MIPIFKSVALMLCLLLSFAPLSFADLYETSVPVTGQGERERGTALRTALAQVLVKVTGHRDSLESPVVEQAMGQPMRFVQQYFYQPLPADESLAESLREAGYSQMLQASFDPAAVNGMLQEAGVPQWGRTRPVTLLWVAVEDAGERWLLGEGAGGAGSMRRVMEQHADERGIPLLFPLMDLEDRRQLHFTDVWGNFQTALMTASARYRPGAVLVGRLWRESAEDEWVSRWSLYHDDQAGHWSATGVELDAVIAPGIDGAADLLAARHARVVTPDGLSLVDIVVSDIDGIRAYDRAMAYLRGLDPVSRLQVAEVEGDRVRFRLEIDADSDNLVRLIALGSALAPVDRGLPGSRQAAGDGVRELSYRLLP